MMKVVITLMALIFSATVFVVAQEPGIPLAFQTLTGVVDQVQTPDSGTGVQVSAGFYQTLPLAWFTESGDWTQQGDKKDLYRTAVFVSVKRLLGKHLAVGFCLPWYRTTLSYSGQEYEPGKYGVEKVSEIRLYANYNLMLGRLAVCSEVGTNIPVGNGLPSALHPAFPSGENGYLTFWGKTGILFPVRWNLMGYGSVSYDLTTPRSGAVIEGIGALNISSGTTSLIQGSINPGNRLTFAFGAVRDAGNFKVALGYGFSYRFMTLVSNILPEFENDDQLVAQLFQPRRVLHMVHAGCFRSWHQFSAGTMIQVGVGGVRSWSEFLMSGLISYHY